MDVSGTDSSIFHTQHKTLIKQLVENLVSPALQFTLKKLKNLPGALCIRRTLQSRDFFANTDKPALYYGEVLPRAPGSIIHGGKVKLTLLETLFPEQQKNFNLIYLVSSALPRHAIEIVRWAKSCGALFVLNQNGVAYPAWAGKGYRLLNYEMQILLDEADFVFYQSEFCKTSADRYLGKAESLSQIAYNCVDTTYFTPSSQPPDSAVCRLLAMGTHQHAYRVISVLETVMELIKSGFPVHLTIAGNMTWRNAKADVDNMIRSNQLEAHVTLHPAFTAEQAPALYRNAHILLHPKYNDPCPTVPIEAMACGLPVVGSMSGGMPELISEEAGILFPVPMSWERDYWPTGNEMADAVRKILSHWSKFSEAAREHAVKKFSKEIWLDAHTRVFDELIRPEPVYPTRQN